MNARLKSTAISAPTSQKQAEQLLRDIGDLQREVKREETKMNDKLAEIKQRHGDKVKPTNNQIDDLFKSLHTWAEANKNTLLEGKLKSAKMATGDVGWRTTPPKVRISGGIAVVLERLKNFGLTQFIRQKEEIDKDKILADPVAVEGVAGISISQREEFWIKPFESEIEKAKAVK